LSLKNFLLCSAFAVALPVGQMLFKWAAVYNERLTGGFPLRLFGNYPLFAAFAWYGVTALVWFYTLTRVPLSVAYPFSIIGAALVPLMAWAVFKEPLGWRFALGYLLMLAGFLVVLQGQARS
jgi:drug/metabolite transporter (DMT)-like permease